MYGKQWEDPGTRSLPMYEYFKAIAERFDRGPKQQLAGFGVAKWPFERKVAWVYRPKAGSV
jgi:hypothetical protein